MRRKHIHVFCATLGLLCYSSLLYAQQAITGVITDSETNLPIEIVTVTLTQGARDRFISYTLTNAAGQFSLSTNQQSDSLHLTVSLLGYKTLKANVRQGESLNLRLEQQEFNLKEVEVRPGRVWGQRDTINYDVASFLTAKDQSIKDVLQKLPGVDVDELTGRIAYQGKDISNFYVEGMELMGGRYNQLNSNLQARSVDKVQLLENHQPIRLLQDKVASENVALNIKLKPEFRDRWMGNIGLGTGLEPVLWSANNNAIQISRNSQSAYFYKGNNTGNNVKLEQTELTNPMERDRLKERESSSFIPQLSFSAPLKEERLLFNGTHSLSGNRLYKLNETTQLRLNAGYIYDINEQERGSETVYFMENDTISISEQNSSRLRSHVANLQAVLENNTDKHFLTNRFSINGNWQEGATEYTGVQNLHQQIETNAFDARNYLRNMWKKDDYTMEVYSLLRFRNLPSSLLASDNRQAINLRHFYTEQAASILKSKNLFTQRYTAGLSSETSNLKNGYSLFFTPFYQWRNSYWRTSLNLPFAWNEYAKTDFGQLTFSPTFNLSFEPNYAWRFNIHASHRERIGDLTDFYSSPYYTNYRTIIRPNGELSTSKQQAYSTSGEYKDIINELFATLSVNYTNGRSSQTIERLLENEIVTQITRTIPSKNSGWSANGTFSKGFYPQRLKTSISLSTSSNKGEQLIDGVLLSYRTIYLQGEPKVNWNPIHNLESEYTTRFRYNTSRIGQSKMEPLVNITQKLTLSYTLDKLTINTSAEHYHNQITKDNTLNTLFTDISLRYKKERWTFNAELNNLFDKRQYSYTSYNPADTYSSWINIRPREFIVSASLRL